MFYPKNVPNWERTVRVVGGLVLITLSAYLLVNGISLALAVVGLLSAFFLVVTGFIGWCPACAMLGRKLKQDHSKA